ncbi:hypothetical protein GCM10007301_00730 [Azorhizobium oxalatiphilum]|uniref:Uncharacterized protein n=1 Tax=Azorhizobium oxalatiphilum TaxID=980631 RepID=A0A917F2S1_9HYPH|nr:hypothetical protein [Azorhizobium oxalatiphilum]GGF45071.1 hypothetical protein GCM10007301_00730 [Azorhizobium oxalatiphilum]
MPLPLARLSLALAALLVSGSLALAAEAEFPRGSLVGLVPPEGMGEATTFPGFEDRAKSASILIVEMPPEAYEQVAAGFTDAALGTKGIAVEKRDNIPLKDIKNVLVTGTQTVGPIQVRKWVLLAGSDKGTALITVQVPEANAAALPDQVVRTTLSTLAFRAPPTAEEQLKALPFQLTNLEGFRLLRVLGNTAAFLTDGPKNEFDAAAQPLFVISVAAGSVRDDERATFSVRTLTTTPGFRDLKIERAEPLRINNMPGFEVMANAKDGQTGAPVKIVQWIRFGTNGYMRMMGVVKADAFTDYYGRLRGIRDGVDTGGPESR